MRKTDQFRYQHDEIVQVVTELTGYLEEKSLAENIPDVIGLLVRLSGKIKVHLAMEDSMLYPRLATSPDPLARSLADMYQTEMGDLSEIFKTYIEKWLSSESIETDKRGFIAETQSLFAALSDRIRRENEILYPVADRL